MRRAQIVVNGKIVCASRTDEALVILPDGAVVPDWLLTDCTSGWIDGTGTKIFSIRVEHIPSAPDRAVQLKEAKV